MDLGRFHNLLLGSIKRVILTQDTAKIFHPTLDIKATAGDTIGITGITST